MNREQLPEKTVERLSGYRRTLLNSLNMGLTHIYSHSLASIHGITAVQVRRDLMLIGFSCDNKKGYNVRELIGFIGNILDTPEPVNIAVIGMGNLGSAITSYFNGKRSKLRIVSAFDTDKNKIGKTFLNIPCYDIASFTQRCVVDNINIVVLTLPTRAVLPLVPILEDTTIKGVLNFTSMPIKFSDNTSIYVEDYDIITLLEKVAYYTKDIK